MNRRKLARQTAHCKKLASRWERNRFMNEYARLLLARLVGRIGRKASHDRD